jgi:hypothetical protein
VFTPLALDVIARELFQSTTWNTGGASSSDRIANENIWAGMFQPVASARLSNPAYTGYSTAAWYMLADPADAPVMEVGSSTASKSRSSRPPRPTSTRSAVRCAAISTSASKKAEYRGGVKMKGEA